MSADIAFLGLARDCAATIPNLLALLAAMRAEGLACIALIGENGSSDETRALLAMAAARGELTLVPTPFMAAEPDRLRRMALGREHLKDMLETSGQEPRVVSVLDTDNVMAHPPSARAILAAMAKLDRRDVFAVSATSRPHYYDLLAYEDSGQSFTSLLDDLARRRSNILAYYAYFARRIYPEQTRLTQPREQHCISAFNGLCLYKGGLYRRASYLGGEPGLCEHVVLNRRLHAAGHGTMLIDPDLCLATPRDHRQEAFAPFVLRRLRKLLAMRRLSAGRLHRTA